MNAPSRWTYVFAGLSMALAAFCVVQWRREATLRTELAEVGGQVAVSEKKAFDAAKLDTLDEPTRQKRLKELFDSARPAPIPSAIPTIAPTAAPHFPVPVPSAVPAPR